MVTGDVFTVLSDDTLELDSVDMVDIVMLRLGSVVLWPEGGGGELPRVKLGRDGLPGSDVEWRSAWLCDLAVFRSPEDTIILVWRLSRTDLAMEATSVSGSRSSTIKLPNTRW